MYVERNFKNKMQLNVRLLTWRHQREIKLLIICYPLNGLFVFRYLILMKSKKNIAQVVKSKWTYWRYFHTAPYTPSCQVRKFVCHLFIAIHVLSCLVSSTNCIFCNDSHCSTVVWIVYIPVEYCGINSKADL